MQPGMKLTQYHEVRNYRFSWELNQESDEGGRASQWGDGRDIIEGCVAQDDERSRTDVRKLRSTGVPATLKMVVLCDATSE